LLFVLSCANKQTSVIERWLLRVMLNVLALALSTDFYTDKLMDIAKANKASKGEKENARQKTKKRRQKETSAKERNTESS
jgi:hypothetical protein